jgi:hypothetical protein
MFKNFILRLAFKYLRDDGFQVVKIEQVADAAMCDRKAVNIKCPTCRYVGVIIGQQYTESKYECPRCVHVCSVIFV